MAPLTFFFTLDIFLGMSALRLVSIPMFTALRRLTVLVVLSLEYFLLKKTPSQAVITAVCVAVFGAILAGAGDIGFDLFGYMYALLVGWFLFYLYIFEFVCVLFRLSLFSLFSYSCSPSLLCSAFLLSLSLSLTLLILTHIT